MLIHVPAFLTAVLLYHVTATPYFKPWLETRQSPTLQPVADLIYPPQNDKTTCPADPNNLFNGYNLVAAQRKRNLHQTFKTQELQRAPLSRRQASRPALVNGTCTTVASFSFVDWEESYNTNTATISLTGGHQYTFSIAANVEVKKLEAWTRRGNDWKVLNDVSPNAKNTTLITALTETTLVHWKIYFRYGHPDGKVAVFSNAPPPGNAVPASRKRRRAAYAFGSPKPP